MIKPGIVVLLAAVLCQHSLWAGAKRTVQVRWEELNGMIAGERVTVEGNFPAARGRVVTVDPAGIDLDTGRRLTREAVKRIRLVRHAGNGRSIGRRIGGAAGLGLGLAGAAVIGLTQEWRSTSNQKAATVALAAGGLPAGLIIGHLLGRKMDEEVVWIELVIQVDRPTGRGAVP